MGIQSSINSLLSQAQQLAAFYKGFEKAGQILEDTTAAKNESKIQTDIAAGNAPTKDGKVDSEWLQKRRGEFKREKYYEEMFDSNGNLSGYGQHQAQLLQARINSGIILGPISKDFYNDKRVQEYLKAISPNSGLKNEVAEKLARSSVEARTKSINKTKSNFDEHTASLIKYYGKGSGNP